MGGVCLFLPAALSAPVALASILNSAARACREVRESKSVPSLVAASLWGGGAVFAFGLLQFAVSLLPGWASGDHQEGISPALSLVLTSGAAMWAACAAMSARWRTLVGSYIEFDRT